MIRVTQWQVGRIGWDVDDVVHLSVNCNHNLSRGDSATHALSAHLRGGRVQPLVTSSVYPVHPVLIVTSSVYPLHQPVHNNALHCITMHCNGSSLFNDH